MGAHPRTVDLPMPWLLAGPHHLAQVQTQTELSQGHLAQSRFQGSLPARDQLVDLLEPFS